MNQEKIGAFIAESRKAQGLTQKELAEKIGMSDKTISKWERGACIPDISVMMDLCNILEIDINDLLSGEKLETEDYHKKAEENIMNLMEENQQAKKDIKHEGLNTIWGFVGVLVMFFFTVMCSMGLYLNNLIFFLDMPSLITILIVDIFMLFATNNVQSFFRAFALAFNEKKSATEKEIKSSIIAINLISKATIMAGVLACLINMVAILLNLYDITRLGPNLAVAILTNVYSMIIVIILLPIKARLENRTNR